jgi:hypothetical protein
MNLNNGQFNNNGNFGRPSNNANALEESQDDKKGTQKPKKKPTGSGKSTTVGLAAVGINGSIKDQEILKQ